MFFLMSFLLPLMGHAQSIQNKSVEGKAESAGIASSWLYVIGIDKYSRIPSLGNAVSDARAVRDVLFLKYQFDKEHTVERYNLDATRNNIINDLYSFSRKLTTKDTLVIFYAGHGELITDIDGYWIPTDGEKNNIGTYISNADLRNLLAAIPARHVWLISDSCFSGALISGVQRSIAPEIMPDRFLRQKQKARSRTVLASGKNEPVADEATVQACRGHSPFACFLLKYLEGDDNLFTLSATASMEVARNVVNNSRQTPVWGQMRDSGDENGDFILINKRKLPSAKEADRLLATDMFPDDQRISILSKTVVDDGYLKSKHRRTALLASGYASGGLALVGFGLAVFSGVSSSQIYDGLSKGKYPPADIDKKIAEGELQDKLEITGIVAGCGFAVASVVLLVLGYRERPADAYKALSPIPSIKNEHGVLTLKWNY